MKIFSVDLIRAIATYVTAVLVVVLGLVIIYATRADVGTSDTRVVVAGFVGLALQFLFGQETATRAVRQTSAAIVNGRATVDANSGLPVA